jgi:hypothetical protein
MKLIQLAEVMHGVDELLSKKRSNDQVGPPIIYQQEDNVLGKVIR